MKLTDRFAAILTKREQGAVNLAVFAALCVVVVVGGVVTWNWWDFLEEFHAPPRRHWWARFVSRRATRDRMIAQLDDDAR